MLAYSLFISKGSMGRTSMVGMLGDVYSVYGTGALALDLDMQL